MSDTMSETMREARDRYFHDNGFGPDGGYGEAWVDLAFGPVHLPFPNTPGRVRAVRFHDLHHVVTGYRTDVLGEAEIGAWEIGAGCKRMWAAWALNLGVMGLGVLRAPRRVFAAFVRGRRSETLYGREYEPLLDAPVEAVRADTRVEAADAEARRPGLGDRALFGVTTGVALGAALAGGALLIVALPFGLVAMAARRRSRATRA
ncbi:MAG: hypothetical protein IT385_11550 [Deltaproteobacteria bacterium]|nr:hypothetical protein [Deltaproteobacteria bacterium]